MKADFGKAYDQHAEAARLQYAHEGGLEKHDLFIADWLTAANEAGCKSKLLAMLCTAILDYARKEVAA